MLEESRVQLDEIMARFSQDVDGLKAIKDSEQLAQETFAVNFEEVKRKIIWPSFIEIGNHLNRFGHDYRITEQQEYVDATAHYVPSNITLNIYPVATDPTLHQTRLNPYISFTADKYAKKIVVMVSTMKFDRKGVIGFDGEIEIKDITTKFVEQKVIDVLTKSLMLH